MEREPMKRRRKRQKRFSKRRKYTLAEKEAYARKLRKRMTPAEVAVWVALRRETWVHNIEFTPQKVTCGYIPDFVCEEHKLVVEIDGPIHKYQRKADAIRQRNIELAGYKVIRFTNREALWKTDWVIQEILSCLPGSLFF